jgi:hypothetical protein
MKNLNDPIGNSTRELPVCRAVSQPTAPPRASIPNIYLSHLNTNTAYMKIFFVKYFSLNLYGVRKSELIYNNTP